MILGQYPHKRAAAGKRSENKEQWEEGKATHNILKLYHKIKPSKESRIKMLVPMVQATQEKDKRAVNFYLRTIGRCRLFFCSLMHFYEGKLCFSSVSNFLPAETASGLKTVSLVGWVGEWFLVSHTKLWILVCVFRRSHHD